MTEDPRSTSAGDDDGAEGHSFKVKSADAEGDDGA